MPFQNQKHVAKVSQNRATFINFWWNETPLKSHCVGRLAAWLVPLCLLLSPASLTTSGHPGAQTARTGRTPEHTPLSSQHSLMVLPTRINSHRTLTVFWDWPLPHKHAWALAPDLLYVCVMESRKMALKTLYGLLFSGRGVTVLSLAVNAS